MTTAAPPIAAAAEPSPTTAGPLRAPDGAPRPPRPRRGLVDLLLRIPLLVKLAGANAVVLVAALAAMHLAHGEHSGEAAVILWSALGFSFAVNLLLVWLALRPVSALEETARRVWHGDFAARVPVMRTADRDMLRAGRTFNALVDGLTGDRERLRLLAAQVIDAQDAERARLARELHDGTAQTLAAAKLQLHAALQEQVPVDLRARLELLRDLVSEALEETRNISHMVHPRVLEDLGIAAALDWLARTGRGTNGPEVEVEIDGEAGHIPPTCASVLYRVAQEGLRNAVRHAGARTITLRLEADDERATIEVVDDGRGFDVAEAEARRPGMGLFAVRERVGLVGGSVDFYSVPGRGTRVSATVPLGGGAAPLLAEETS